MRSPRPLLSVPPCVCFDCRFVQANFAVFNGALYFAAHTDAAGVELWKSDGTADGTVLVKDIYAGSTEYDTYSYEVGTYTLTALNDGRPVRVVGARVHSHSPQLYANSLHLYAQPLLVVLTSA